MTIIWAWVLSTLASAAVLALPLLSETVRAAVAKYVAGFVEHSFEARLEKLKSELRQAEERFSSEIRRKEIEIRSLTEAVLSARSTRQAGLDARRLEAAERVWKAKVGVDKWIMASAIMQSIKFDAAAKASATDQRVKDLFATFDGISGVDPTKELPPAATLERPFITPNVWALFSAYQAVVFLSVAMLKMLANGVGNPELIKQEPTAKILKAALPEYSDYIDQWGHAGYHELLGVLEGKLLEAIQDMLDGKDSDAATLERSSAILATIKKLSTDDPTGALPANLKEGLPPTPSPDP